MITDTDLSRSSYRVSRESNRLSIENKPCTFGFESRDLLPLICYPEDNRDLYYTYLHAFSEWDPLLSTFHERQEELKYASIFRENQYDIN